MPVELPAGVNAPTGVDLAVKSLTVSSTGPYAQAAGILPGEEVTAVNPYHAKAYGVKSDGQFISDGVMNGTTAVLTSASNPFVASDVGKLCLVPGAEAGGALLTTTIASYQSAGQVTLAAASQTAVATAMVTWGTEDTAAWIALYAAAPAGAKVTIPWGYSLYRGQFMGGIAKSLYLDGLGINEIWGTGGDVPSTSPYLAGSVLVQCQAGQNGIDITGRAITVHRRNFGIKFADGIKFANTGHGIYAVSSTMVSGGHAVGEQSSRSDTVIVFGHDGNHYGYYAINEFYLTDTHFRSYGGGVHYIECDSYETECGNAVFIHPDGVVFCRGTAHGYAIKARTSAIPGGLNLMSYFRPQCNFETRPAQFNGLGILDPTAAQYIWAGSLGVGVPAHIAVTDPDLETAFSNPIDFGGSTANNTIRDGGYMSMTPTGGFPTETIKGDRVFAGAVTLQGALYATAVPFYVLQSGTVIASFENHPNVTSIQLDPPNLTGVTAETPSLMVNPRTLTLTGSYATQRENIIKAPTHNGAFTITDDSTLTILGGPGGTATKTRKYQLWLAGTDKMRFDTTTQGTIGANGGATALTANPVGYLPIYVGTAIQIIPYYNP